MSSSVDPLWLSEARYRAIVEDQPDLVCRFLPDGTLTFVNAAYCRYFAVRREDIIGGRYHPIVHPDDVREIEQRVAELSPESPVVYVVNRVIRGDGAERWTEWSNRALYDDQNQLLEYQAAGRDITERKQSEETTARLAAIVASADVAIYSTTLDGAIASWNHAAERMFEYTADEAIGRSIDILVPPDFQDAHLEIPDRFTREEVIDHVETVRLTKSGRRLPISLTLSPITDSSGQIIGISRIARDISEWKRAEQDLEERDRRFRLMADHAPVLIWIADATNGGVYFNKPWLEFTGVPLEHHLGTNWLALIHPDDRAQAAGYCQEHFDRRQPFTMEFRLQHWSGDYRWVQDSGQPLFLADGSFNGYIGSCVDVHHRKIAEAEAIERASLAREAAEEASRLKDEFLAIVSHELRTPLNAILGWTQLLRSGRVTGDAAPRALDTIERNAQMQAQLVEDLLDVSRIVNGKLALRLDGVNLATVIRAAADAVAPGAASKGINLLTRQAEVDALVSGDAGRLQQAVWNLLANAIKFTPEGGTVEMDLGRRDDDAVVVVRDTGVGIPPDALPRIFDRFTQADSRTTRAHGGLGLGLAIVRYVAQAHGGSVHASSPGAGQGATFELVLPLRVGGDAPTPAVSAPIARAALGGLRVLVVDDDQDARDVARAVLEDCGAIVTTASSVEETLGAIDRFQPDIVIADIGMPDQDGWDLIRQIRGLERYADTRAIALTAYAGAQHRDAALAAGYDAHLPKPLDPEALCSVIADLCRTSAAGSA